ncbi:MAG: N-6 DNA methylase [Burkholderiales bacterium]|nr:N-6 DNA methylase [Burkholderiales bacterium]
MNTNEIVQKLWNLCNILKDDGITYHQYVGELTQLLFLKMARETGSEARIPEGLRWDDLLRKDGIEQFRHYKHCLLELGECKDTLIAAIYNNAVTNIREPRHLAQLIADIDQLDWFAEQHERDDLGDMYEGLLEKNAAETKSGAGQYFTPRVLIDSVVSLMQPKLGEVIQDPAAGTGGFLIAAGRYLRKRYANFETLSDTQYAFQQQKALLGMELVPETRRLALMNCFLHGLGGNEAEIVKLGNTLSNEGRALNLANLVLSNPPFGSKKGGGLPTRDDFAFPTSNKQLVFLQHIYRSLLPGGRAAVVLPDNVLFEGGVGADIRRDLMDKCHLHTILRLPTGIFYAQGVKTNVLFFTKVSNEAKASTQQVWVYDLRANMPSFGKRTPLTRAHFAEFEQAYGNEPNGTASRTDQGETGRWRSFSRDWIKERGDSLDISWLKDENAENAADLPEPTELAAEIVEELNGALAELQDLLAELGVEVEE